MWSKENILSCLSKGTVSRCISVFGCRGYLLENDYYALLAGVFKFNMVLCLGLTNY